MGGGAAEPQWYTFDTPEEAERERERAAKAAQRLNEREASHTWAMVIEVYCTERAEECVPRAIDTLRGRLRRFFAPCLDQPAHLDQRGAQALYDALRPKVSVQEHRHCLSRAKALAAWLVDKGEWKANPLGRIRPIGRPKRGKPQLTRDEARALLAWCLAEHQRDEGAAAVAVLLLLGLRASELCGLAVRDLDDAGRVLHVRGTKTAAARRAIVVPHPTPEAPHLPDLRHVLQVQAIRARKREPGEVPPISPQLWGRDRWWVRREVVRCCQAAGVPTVCAHGLRGTWASLARSAGAAPLAVAAAMGHAGTQIQDRHYVQPDAAHAGQQEAAVAALTRR